jgi:phosphatidylserine/phosphatidylglycerophosphate/cardiolipin synthase-like enzyme
MPTYLEQLKEYLETVHPQSDGLWAYSEHNQLPANWLLATPGGVWGQAYNQFKMAVKGGYPDFDLQTCTVSDGPTQSCQTVEASLKAANTQPAKLLVGHSDNLVDAVYRVIASAEKIVDITLLTPPTTRFLAAMRNAVTFLSRKPANKRPIIRVLESNPPGNLQADAITLLGDLVRDVDRATPLQIYVGVMSSATTSWNHAKIIAVDGARAIVGGHNLWGTHYLDVKPVFDVSMAVTGEAALHAHDYADFMWRFLLASLSSSWWRPAWTRTNGWNNVAGYALDAKTQHYTATKNATPDVEIYARMRGDLATAPAGNVAVLSVGRKAGIDLAKVVPNDQSYQGAYHEPGDVTLTKLVSLAQSTIRICQHALSFAVTTFIDEDRLGWRSSWNFVLFREMGKAIQRGVDIYITLSNPGGWAGDLPTSEFAQYTSDPPSRVNEYLLHVMTKYLQVDSTEAKRAMGAHFRVSSLRYSADETYPGATPIPNHAKTMIVDDRVFYIGSQNLYLCDLNEFGYVVEDPAAAQSYLDQYWTPLWAQSGRTVDTTYSDELEREMDGDAVLFVLETRHNVRLARTWTDTLATRQALTTPEELEDTANILNEIIARAGYRTSSSRVLAVLHTAFFDSQRDDHAANDAARKFVKDITTDASLLQAFSTLLQSQHGSDAETDAAVTAFLHDKNYDCTATQLAAAIDELRAQHMSYWQGKFDGSITPDGGASWGNFTPSPHDELRRRMLLAAGAAADTSPDTSADTAGADGPSLTVLSNTRARLGDDEIKGLRFQDGVLSWDMASGNKTSGSIAFSQISQPAIDDPFTGYECFGTLTFPDTGQAPNRGKVSYYGRWSKPANVDDPDKPVPFSWPVWILIGLAGLAGLVAAGFAIAKIRRARAQQDAEDAYKKTDGDEVELEPLTSRETTSHDRLTEDYRGGSITKQQFDEGIATVNGQELRSRSAWSNTVERTRRVLDLGEWQTSAHTDSDVSQVHDRMTSSLDSMLAVQENQLGDVLRLRPPDSGLEQLAESISGLRGQVQDLTPNASSPDIGKLFQRISKATTSVNDYVVGVARSRATGNTEWLDTARQLDAQRIDLAERANEARSKLDVLDTSYDPPDGIDIPETEIDLPDEFVE